MKERLINFLRDLKFFLSIYTWLEIWVLVGFAISATGIWLVIAMALNLPNPLRSVVIWAIILGFAILVPRALTSIPRKKI